MSEGAPPAPRSKRSNTRLFKNPPQPYMCIEDCLAGTQIPCYINVLSWDKVDMPANPNEPIPLYGGMKIQPPRSETRNVYVFAVIANPMVLHQKGKFAEDLKEQSCFIEVLLDFIETVNKDIVFNRQYVILKDRDITGELKEVWMSVQSQRDRESAAYNQHETWIDTQPQLPQLPPNNDQQQHIQQQHQIQQNQQMYQQPPLPQQQKQSHQPPMIQQQTQQQMQPHLQSQPIQQHYQQRQLPHTQQMMPGSYITPQPPQYQPNIVYDQSVNNDCSNYDRYNNYQQHNPEMFQWMFPIKNPEDTSKKIPKKKMPVKMNLFNPHVNNRQKNWPSQQGIPEPQKNCPPYSASQYYPRNKQMVSQYVNSNINSTYSNLNTTYVNSQINTNITGHTSDHIMIQSYDNNSQKLENLDQKICNEMQYDYCGMQPQMPSNLLQPVICYDSFVTQDKSVRYYEKNPPTYKMSNELNNAYKNAYQNKEVISENIKPKSPVKVLQRDTSNKKQNTVSYTVENNMKADENIKACNIQVTDLDEEESKIKDVAQPTAENNSKKPEPLDYAAAVTRRNKEFNNSKIDRQPTVSNCESQVSMEFKETKQQSLEAQKKGRVKVVFRKNKSNDNVAKVTMKSDIKTTKNGLRYSDLVNNAVEKCLTNNEEQVKGSSVSSSVEMNQGMIGKNQYFKHKSSDSPRRTQSTVNSIIKSVFKIHQGSNGSVDENLGKKQKVNGQIKSAKVSTSEQEENYQGYTILKKADITTLSDSEEITKEIRQLSVTDSKETVDKSTVIS